MIQKKITKAYICESDINKRQLSKCNDTIGGIKSIRVMSIEEASKLFPDIDFGVKSINLVENPLPGFEFHTISGEIKANLKLEEYDNEAPI